MKGQKTLAMVVSMSIISIVILIMIGLIQDSTTSFRESDTLDTRVNEIRSACSQTCTEIQANKGDQKREKVLEYCAERIDLGEDEGEVLGSGYNSYCSDGARCFNFDSCSYRGMDLNAENCRQIMCRQFNSSSNTDERVYSYFEEDKAQGDFGAGTCNLRGIKDSAGYNVSNWWTENFDPENGVDSICE